MKLTKKKTLSAFEYVFLLHKLAKPIDAIKKIRTPIDLEKSVEKSSFINAANKLEIYIIIKQIIIELKRFFLILRLNNPKRINNISPKLNGIDGMGRLNVV